MSKFQYVYTSSNDEPEVFIDEEFPAIEIIQNLKFSDDVTWQSILHSFAKFLESTGYVNVVEKLEIAFGTLEEKMGFPYQLFDTDAEDYTSNVGLDK